MLETLNGAVLANAEQQARLQNSHMRLLSSKQLVPRIGRYRGMHGAECTARVSSQTRCNGLYQANPVTEGWLPVNPSHSSRQNAACTPRHVWQA